MDDAYELLKRNKVGDESFSDVIRKIAGKKGSIMDLAGAWSHISHEKIEGMKRVIEEMRKPSERQRELLR